MRILLRALGAVSVAGSALFAQQEPPPRLNLGSGVEETAPRDTVVERGSTSAEMRTAFVRHQLLLGAVSYGPAFATMLGTEPATRLAGWLVMTGGSFFAASEVARQWEITPARHMLSTRMGWRGSATGLALGNAWQLPEGEAGALTLVGGLTGSAIGVWLGSGLTEGEATAAVVGHDLVAATAYAVTWMVDPDINNPDGFRWRARVALPLVVGWTGYAIGRSWAGNAPYEVTAGDASLLWLGAGIGAAAAGTTIIESEPENQTVAGALLAGGLVGVWAADRFLVRRLDHTRSEAALVASGSGAGALMGIGLGVLLSGEGERNSAPTFAFGTIGAITGAWLTERYSQPARDEGRRLEVGSRLQLNPMGAVAALSGAPGMHSLVRFTF
jgi:hypothetical protein